MVRVFVPDADGREALRAHSQHAYALDDASTLDRLWDHAGYENVRVVADDDRVVGGCLVLPAAQWFGGAPVPSLGVAAVAVGGAFVRRGYATALVGGLLRECREQGIALSTLYASNHALYRRSGYDHAGTAWDATVPSPPAWSGDRGLPVREVSAADHVLLERLYERVARDTPGFLVRTPYLWQRVYGPTRAGRPAWGQLVEGPDGPSGYLFYRKEPGNSRHSIQVVDAVATDLATARRLWGIIADMSSMADLVRLQTAPTDLLYLAHADPRFELRLFEAWMLRVVDPYAALTARGYPAVSGRVDLEVHDPVFGVERVRLDVEEGVGYATSGGSGAVRVDSRGLASMFSGYLHPRAARAAGRVDGSDADLALLGLWWSGPAPWLRDRF